MKKEIILLENLDLYPLNSEELSLWLNDISTLEKTINCFYNGYKITEELRDYIYSQLIIGLSEPEENWIWYTYWFIVRKIDNTIIGTLSFKGKPDINDEIEIGYALNKEYENHGYMTEALRGLCQWIKENTDIKDIIAETKLDNKKSQNLLKRCKFKPYKETDYSLSFKLNILSA